MTTWGEDVAVGMMIMADAEQAGMIVGRLLVPAIGVLLISSAMHTGHDKPHHRGSPQQHLGLHRAWGIAVV